MKFQVLIFIEKIIIKWCLSFIVKTSKGKVIRELFYIYIIFYFIG